MEVRYSFESPESIIKKSTDELKTTNKIINRISAEVKKLQHSELKAKFFNAGVIKSKTFSAKVALSKIPDKIRNSSQFVSDDDDIKEKNKKVIENNSLERIKKSNKTVRVTLTEEEFNSLKAEYGDPPMRIPQHVFDRFLYKNSKDSFSFTNDLLLNVATKNEKEPDLDLPPVDPEQPDSTNRNLTDLDDDNETSVNVTFTQEELLKKLNELLNKLKSPEHFPEVLNSPETDDHKNGVHYKRATEQDIETQITGMKLKGGLADEPAFYDFHSLQIAFDHIWKELFDNSVENGLNDLYQQLVELEIEETDLPTINPRKPFNNVRTFVVGALHMIQQEPDAAVLKAFAISKEIWNALTYEQRSALTSISNLIVGINERVSEISQAYEALFDGQARRVKSISISSPGQGYRDMNRVRLVGGVGVPAIIRITGTAANTGVVTAVELVTSGLYFTPPDSVSGLQVAGGSGTGLKVNIELDSDFTYDTVEESRTLYQKAQSYFADQRLTLPLRVEGENIISYALEKLKSKKTEYLTLHSILQQLEKRLKENYAFTIFAANEKERSINFGIVVTYRQKWTPVCYQAGKLVHSLPLGPKQEISYAKKIVSKQGKNVKETSTSSEKRLLETSDNVKAESDIMSKAYKKVNANVSARASYSGWGWSFGAEASYGKESTSEAADNRKDFREAVVKAAQEYKNERALEINTSESSEFEAQESGKISNPNDEIPVTYLFYELQQRYQLNEKLHKITPSVLVAQEVPNPSDIDEEWLVAHTWIIKKALLDDTFMPALYYLSNKIVGDEIALDELKKNMEIHRELVRKTTNEYTSIKEQLGSRYAALEKSVQRRIEAVDERRESFWEKIVEDALEREDFAESVEVAKLREEAAKDAYDNIARSEKESRAALDREVTALQAATENYTKTLAEHLNRKTEIERLRIHIKDNILYYMQAIWSFEPPDQRFLRLYKEQVPDLYGELRYSFIKEDAPQAPDLLNKSYQFKVEFELKDRDATGGDNAFSGLKFRSLIEIADVDTLLGFKGNYMIFPMKENNAITDYMMTPYLNRYNGLSELDPTADWTITDYDEFVALLKKSVLRGDISRTDYESKLKPELRKLHKKIVTNPLRQNEEIIVPTGSLYIEALPGKHPILEDFKLMHRAVDVKKVQAEARFAEIENLRSAARLLANQLEDPSIEKKILMEGAREIVVNPDSE